MLLWLAIFDKIRAERRTRVAWRELFEIPSKGGNEKRGEETKILKRGWGYGFINGAGGGGAGTPLQTMIT